MCLLANKTEEEYYVNIHFDSWQVYIHYIICTLYRSGQSGLECIRTSGHQRNAGVHNTYSNSSSETVSSKSSKVLPGQNVIRRVSQGRTKTAVVPTIWSQNTAQHAISTTIKIEITHALGRISESILSEKRKQENGGVGCFFLHWPHCREKSAWKPVRGGASSCVLLYGTIKDR